MKINLTFGYIPKPPGCIEVSDELIERSINESRGQKGTLLMEKNKLEGERRMVFGEPEFSYKGTKVKPDAFLPTEYMDWRDK